MISWKLAMIKVKPQHMSGASKNGDRGIEWRFGCDKEAPKAYRLYLSSVMMRNIKKRAGSRFVASNGVMIKFESDSSTGYRYRTLSISESTCLGNDKIHPHRNTDFDCSYFEFSDDLPDIRQACDEALKEYDILTNDAFGVLTTQSEWYIDINIPKKIYDIISGYQPHSKEKFQVSVSDTNTPMYKHHYGVHTLYLNKGCCGRVFRINSSLKGYKNLYNDRMYVEKALKATFKTDMMQVGGESLKPL